MLLILPLCGMWFMGHGTYIHAKAKLAQFLLEAAWAKTLGGEKEVKPWPWADSWPVCRLDVPGLGISRIVLAGASGSSLAFGPGHLSASAEPGRPGNIVIAGHRDTHFRFLKNLIVGARINLQTSRGKIDYFRITAIMILHESETFMLEDDGSTALTLVTCYPFDAITTGGPLRYVVIAEPDRMTNIKNQNTPLT